MLLCSTMCIFVQLFYLLYLVQIFIFLPISGAFYENQMTKCTSYWCIVSMSVHPQYWLCIPPSTSLVICCRSIIVSLCSMTNPCDTDHVSKPNEYVK